FKSEAQERAFWAKINLADYFEAEDFDTASFPNLKPSSRPVSLRIPDYLLLRIKERANELNVPYQSLMKRYIAQGALKNS
ncbi:MAG: BrnA antitoxin family protein, partial [Patescibacteria group bacterium]